MSSLKLPGCTLADGETGKQLVPANDNVEAKLSLFSEPTTIADAFETASNSRNLRGKIVMVACGIAASVGAIAWVYLVGTSLVEAAIWMLDL
jgi:hypothetical protein